NPRAARAVPADVDVRPRELPRDEVALLVADLLVARGNELAIEPVGTLVAAVDDVELLQIAEGVVSERGRRARRVGDAAHVAGVQVRDVAEPGARRLARDVAEAVIAEVAGGTAQAPRAKAGAADAILVGREIAQRRTGRADDIVQSQHVAQRIVREPPMRDG